MKKRFLPLSMLLITMVLAQAGIVANATGIQGKYTPRDNSKATVSSYMKSVRANQETGLIDPAAMIKAQKEAGASMRGTTEWHVLGPDNYGALTRAMIYDEYDPTNNTILIGTMGGRIFESVNGGITMRDLGYDLNAMISDMVQCNGSLYVATGDGRMAHNTNGLLEIGYETSFVGRGICKINANEELTWLPSTNPTVNEGWEFVNELTVADDNSIYAATNGGLRRSADGGITWTMVIEGDATSVEAGNFGKILAVVDKDVYLIPTNDEPVLLTSGESNMLPAEDVEKFVALAPSDGNYMYVSYLKSDYSTGNFYYTQDGGTTWEVALPASGMYPIYSRGYIDNAIEVFPNNPRKILVGGSDVWVLEYSEQGTGVYIPTKVSEGQANELELLSAGSFSYVHSGIQAFLFNPDNANVFFVGTEGGVFRGTYSQQTYNFVNGNRYFITDDEHTSVTRMFGVGISGLARVLGGSLDHGSILIEGLDNLNNVTTGRAILPNCDPTSNAAVENGYSVFTNAFAAGQCAISAINQDIMFLTTTGSNTTPLFRTQTAGADYDMSNFYNADNTGSDVIVNPDAFRTPFAMYENFNDEYSTRTTIYAPKDTIHYAGEKVIVRSAIANHPFEYVLPVNVNKGDTLEGIKDIISATMICAVKDDGKETGKIYMTRNSHIFNELSEWWKVYNTEGLPTAVAMSNDGDMAMVGTATGNLYRLKNLKQAVSANLACIDSTECIIEAETLDNTLFAGRTITSISIVDNDVLVTLGNYGNTDYVFRSINGGNTFTSIQHNLAQFPIYSCVIEKGSHTLFVGTEYGIYSLEGALWIHQGNVAVPVTDMKQVTTENRPSLIIILGYDNGAPVYEISYGVYTEGLICAATYGNGIIGCGDYLVGGGELSIDENIEETSSLEMSVYPNPARGTANISFEITESANVSYEIYDLTGRMVSSRILGTMPMGSHHVSFSTDNMACGSYIVRVIAGNKTNSTKIMVF